MWRGALITEEGIKHGYLIPSEMKFEESRLDYRDFYFSKTFFNAHTHLGDAAFKEAPRMDLEKLVAPNGYKQKMLNSTSPEVLRREIKKETEFARKCGTSHFLDFREGGLEGLKIVEGLDGIIALARPKNADEAEKIQAFGFAYSSARDHDEELLKKVREIAKRKKMIFAIHAGEKDCGDVEGALELQPDLLIHMNCCEEMLRDVITMEIPIVSCARSNAFFGLLNTKVYKILKDYDFWMIGSDNAMIASPSLLEEMHFLSYLIDDDTAIFKAAIRGYELFNMKYGYVVYNRNYNFRRTNDPLKTLVRRASAMDIEAVII